MSLEPAWLSIHDGCLRDRRPFSETMPLAPLEPRQQLSLSAAAEICTGHLAPAITIAKAPGHTDIIGATMRIQASNGAAVYRITEWDADVFSYWMEWPD